MKNKQVKIHYLIYLNKWIKRLLPLLLLIGCTWVDITKTTVKCPCQVTEVHHKGGDMYYIKMNTITDETTYNSNRYIMFYTTTYHQIGDIIK